MKLGEQFAQMGIGDHERKSKKFYLLSEETLWKPIHVCELQDRMYIVRAKERLDV